MPKSRSLRIRRKRHQESNLQSNRLAAVRIVGQPMRSKSGSGFFDPGFGDPEAGGQGSRAVLEVRSFEVPFVVEPGQVVGRLVYEALTEVPDKLYGQALRSNYQKQRLKLSKHFRAG